MIFDQWGLPKDSGATDFMDSARLAGLMAICKVPNAPSMLSYIIKIEGDKILGVRHPFEGSLPGEMPSNNPNNFTRDQLVCLAAGLYAQGQIDVAASLYVAAKSRGNRAQNTEADYPGTVKKFPNGADFLSPSHMSHLRRCAGLKPTWFGNLWLKLDVVLNGLFFDETEQNQLICMCIVAGKEYLRMYKKWNKNWDMEVQLYWNGWRNEPELSKQMIDYIISA